MVTQSPVAFSHFQTMSTKLIHALPSAQTHQVAWPKPLFSFDFLSYSPWTGDEERLRKQILSKRKVHTCTSSCRKASYCAHVWSTATLQSSAVLMFSGGLFTSHISLHSLVSPTQAAAKSKLAASLTLAESLELVCYSGDLSYGLLSWSGL